MNTKSLLTPTKPISINIFTLFYPKTHYNKGFSSISLKKKPCNMNLYPPENTQKFQFDVKYKAYLIPPDPHYTSKYEYLYPILSKYT